MTRINVVPVQELSRQHLISEWRELPRTFALAHKASLSSKPWTSKQPDKYILNTGHVLFFYDKLGFLADRHEKLTQEMLDRGYKPSYTDNLRDVWKDIPKAYWKDYTPTEDALRINRERIKERTK